MSSNLSIFQTRFAKDHSNTLGPGASLTGQLKNRVIQQRIDKMIKMGVSLNSSENKERVKKICKPKVEIDIITEIIHTKSEKKIKETINYE